MALPWPVFAWKGGLFMARKSRKHQTVTLPHPLSEAAGYIRLSAIQEPEAFEANIWMLD